jgi:inorganic triphosphatase YgiF
VVETELKFRVDPSRRDALKRAVAGTAGGRAVRLAARYFDTPDGRLAAAGLALRLRREGRRRWVQTLKGRGDGLMQRLEHEVVLDDVAPNTTVAVDLARHDGTSAGQALRAALGSHEGELVERFVTDIRRTRRVVRVHGAGPPARVELAFDEGWIAAPAADGPRRRPVAELELELLSGTPQALLRIASRWVQRHGLWLDVRSKAERGHALAAAADAPLRPAVRAEPPQVGPRLSQRQGLAAMVGACLGQVLPNMATVADGLATDPEHVHQLRVGLRRLRTALGDFGVGVAGVDPAWRETLAAAFAALGATRDRDVIAITLAPARAAAQAVGLDVPTAAPAQPAASIDASAGTALRECRFNLALLGLIGFTLDADVSPGDAALIDAARARLARRHRQVLAGGKRFERLDDAARHTLRKRLKRLRYDIEFVAPLFRARPVARYLALLRPAQDALGDYNDLLLAEAQCRAAQPLAAADAFMLGWLAARREGLTERAAARLRELDAAPRFWKR